MMPRPWITGSRRLEGICPLLLPQWWRGKLARGKVLLTYHQALSSHFRNVHSDCLWMYLQQGKCFWKR